MPTGSPQIIAVANISNIQQCLSYLDPDRPLWVIATESDLNRAFYRDFLQADHYIEIPETYCWGCDPMSPPPIIWPKYIDLLGKHITLFDEIVDSLPEHSEIYFWHFLASLGLYTLLFKAAAKGHKIMEIDSSANHGYFDVTSYSADTLPPTANTEFVDMLRHGEKTLGGPLRYLEVRSKNPGDKWCHNGLGIMGTDFNGRAYTELTSWELLGTRYKKQIAKNTPPTAEGCKGRVLFLDDSAFDDARVDKEASRWNLEKYMAVVAAEGWDVHVKPHPRFQSPPELMNLNTGRPYTMLSGWFPAELIAHQYEHLYYICSVSTCGHDHIPKTCLLPLLRFSEPSVVPFYWSHFRMGFEKGGTQITLAAPTPPEVASTKTRQN